MPPFREFLRSRPVLFAGACYILVALACTRVPLFNYLGFECAFVTALCGSFIAGFSTIHLIRPLYRISAGPLNPFPVVRSFVVIACVQLLLLLIPLGVMTVNAIIVPNCDYLEGFAFYLLLPAVSAIFASALGIFCTVHYMHPRIVYTLYFFLSISYVLMLGYFTPAIFSYNFFYGYFPGLSYDELLPLALPLVVFRLWTLAVAGLLVWCAGIIVREVAPDASTTTKGVAALRMLRTRYLPVTVFLGILCTVVFLFRYELGWESSTAFVRSTLGSSLKTPGFTIYFDSTVTSPAELRLLALEHEFRLHQVLDAFALSHAERIESFVYPSADVKRRLVGAGETEIAKPWSRAVHITRTSVDGALKHELVHVIAAPFGVRMINASLSPGLTEGLAVAVEGSWGSRTLAEYAAAIRAGGLAPPIKDLMTPAGFMTNASSVSYVLTGAFSRFLIDRFGMRALLQVYGSGDYEAAYLVPLDTLIAQWQRTTDSVSVSERDRAVVDVMFRRPPIFGKMCARVHARRLRDVQRLMQLHRYDQACTQYEALYAEGGGYEAFSGLLTAQFRLGNFAAVTRLYDSVTAADRVPQRYRALALVAGDASWATGNYSRAESLYTAVRQGELTSGLTEAAYVRLWILSDSGAARNFREYFITEMTDTIRLGWLGRMPGAAANPIAQYVRGKLLLRLRWYNPAAYLLQQAGTLTRDSTAEALREISIGDALWRSGKIQEARRWYWTSLNYDARPSAREVVYDRIARCDWLAALQMPAGDR